MSGVVSASSVIRCDDENDYYSGEDNSGVVCTVVATQGMTATQIVDVNQPFVDEQMPAVNWTFKKLIIPEGFRLWFVNSQASLADSGNDGKSGGNQNNGKGGTPGLDPSEEEYRDGGSGGDGGSGDGGGGGGGGAGGQQFYRGGNGPIGGTGKGNTGQGGEGVSSGPAGAHVILFLEELQLEEGSELSVSGSDGSKDCSSGREGGEGARGGGGGGGDGGGGAGQLVIYLENLSGTNGDINSPKGIMNASGGSGGNGCNGGNDVSGLQANNKGGGGGGAGGGGDAGVIELLFQQELQSFDSLFVNGGTPGQKGEGVDMGEDGSEAYEGKDSSSPQPRIVREYKPRGAQDNNLSYCTDGKDNDFDGYADFEDADCFNLNQNSDPQAHWDNDGPITPQLPLLGVEQGNYLDYSVWDPFAMNGTDAICGDDTKTFLCEQAHVCEPTNCNLTYCDAIYTQECIGGNLADSVDCYFFEDENGQCKEGVVPPCTTEFAIGEYSCEGTIPCSSVPANLCEEVLGKCVFEQSIESCTPKTDCSTFSEEECLQKAEDCSITYFDLGRFDQSYVAQTNTDVGRYYCAQDVSIEDSNEFVKLTPSSSFNEWDWNWWDAYESGTSFMIHHYAGIDYIANGQEWFYCNANQSNIHESFSNAKPVEEAENFSGAVQSGGFTCVEALTAAGNFFDDQGFTDDDGWFGYFDICEDDEDVFCCKETNDEEFMPGFVIGEGENNNFLHAITDGDCANYCYFNGSALENPLSSPTKLGNLNSQSFLWNEYCEVFTYDPSCTSGNSLTPLFGENQQEGFFEKKSCGLDMAGCLQETIALDQNCSDIVFERDNTLYRGHRCSEQQYCGGTQEYLLSSDVIEGNEGYDEKLPICCLGEQDTGEAICMDFQLPVLEESCIQAGGDFLSGEDIQENYYCQGGIVSEGTCCLGGSWVPRWDTLFYKTITQPEAFICYEHNTDNRFAECCTDFTTCFNEDTSSWFTGFQNTKDYGYFGKGGVLHTIENYDRFTGRTDTQPKLLVDYVRIFSLSASDNQPFEVDVKKSDAFYSREDWSTFDYLEFDIAYTLEKVDFVILTDKKDNQSFFNLSTYLVNGKTPLRWHHAVIPLNLAFSENDSSDFNFSEVETISFSTTYDNNNLYIAVDNFFLSENETKDGGLLNTDNYYCTGNFGNWVKNLDGETDKGFLNDDGNDNGDDEATIEDFGKYWYACEAQASFDWTGHACCGDDTRQAHYSTTNQGEYYADTDGGCFHGNPIYSNKLVGHILNDKRYNNLVFYKGEFYACVEEDYPGANKTVAYNSTGVTTNHLIPDENYKQAYAVVGDYVCDSVSKKWIDLSEVSRTRIIASKMYNLTRLSSAERYADYDIFCEHITNASHNTPSYVNEHVIDFCTFHYSDEEEKPSERIMIGLSLGDVEIESFLEELYNHLLGVGQIRESEEIKMNFIKACEGIDPGFGNSTEFFRTCEDVEDVHMRYNPDFKILFVSVDVPEPVSDFGGFFKDDATLADYIRHYWNSFISIFDNWFGGGNQAGEGIVWTNETILPLFAGDGDIYAQNVVQLQKVVVRARGEREIYGFTEQRYAQPNTQIEDYLYTALAYKGFNNSVEFLAERYYGIDKTYGSNRYDLLEPYELNYFKGADTQFIVLIEPQEAADVTYEPGYDWRRLAIYLRIDDFSPTNSFNAESGDGVVDYGEWCDKNPTVFKFNNNTCAFWNETHPYCLVSCSNENTLNHAYCKETPGDCPQQ